MNKLSAFQIKTRSEFLIFPCASDFHIAQLNTLTNSVFKINILMFCLPWTFALIFVTFSLLHPVLVTAHESSS